MFKCEEGLQTHYSFGLLKVRSFNFYLIQLKLKHDILFSGSLIDAHRGGGVRGGGGYEIAPPPPGKFSKNLLIKMQ